MKVPVGEYIVQIDREEYQKVKGGTFSIRLAKGKTPYAMIGGRPLHRRIMNPPDGMTVDHINHDTLDNRKKNLRICTRSQNNWNRNYKVATGTSKYKGVYFEKERNRWVFEINIHNKKYDRKRFKTEKEAALAYNRVAKVLFGEFACLNVIED